MRKLLCMSLLFLSQMVAAADLEFNYARITRRTGGQEINENLALTSGNIQIQLLAREYKIELHDLTLYSSDNQTITLGELEQSQRIPRDLATNKIFIQSNSSGIIITVNSLAAINGISMVVESYAGFGTLVMKVSELNQQPLPPPAPPQPTPPVPDDRDERQCQAQLIEVNHQINLCNANVRDLGNATQSQRQQNVRLEQILEQQNRPLNQCRIRADEVKRDYAQTNRRIDEINRQIESTRIRRQELLAETRIAEESRGRQFSCSVMGRHERFTAVAATRGVAMQMALQACGVNNCGKRAWNPNFNCQTVR